MAVLARAAALASTPFLVLVASNDRGWGRFFVGLAILVVGLAYLRQALAADNERTDR